MAFWASELDPNLFWSEYGPVTLGVCTLLIDCCQTSGVGTVLISFVLMQGMILLSELSRRRIRSINKLIRVGRTEPVVVIRLLITVLNIWLLLFTDWYRTYWDKYILHTVILLGGCMEVWTCSGVEACLCWRCVDVIMVRVKVTRIEPFSQMGSDSADTSQPPNGEIHSSTVTPLYQ